MMLDHRVGMGFQISENALLAGGKQAVRFGNEIQVSPAMYSLMVDADPDELQRLLEKIELITIPHQKYSYARDIGMTTIPFID